MADDEKDWFSRVARTWIFPGGVLGGAGAPPFMFDAVVRESHTSELTVTENPVETGVVVSDHAFMQPLKLELEVAVGDVRLHDKGADGRDVPDVFASTAGRAAKAFELILELQSTAEPFAVQTGLKLYKDMLPVSITTEQDKDTAAFLSARISLRQVIRFSTRTITYPPRKAGKPNHQASKKVSGGEKKAEPVTEQAQAESILHSLVAPSDKFDLKGAAKALIGAGGL